MKGTNKNHKININHLPHHHQMFNSGIINKNKYNIDLNKIK